MAQRIRLAPGRVWPVDGKIGGVEGYQAPPGLPRRVSRAPREAWRRPTRVEPVPGTPFGLIVYGSPPVTSGPAIGSLVAGIAGVLVAVAVFCFGLAGAPDGWGPLVAGAFGVLAAVLGLGGIGLALVGLRQTRRGAPPAPGGAGSAETGSAGAGIAGAGGATERPAAGRGLAVAGLACGAAAVVITVGALALSLVIALG